MTSDDTVGLTVDLKLFKQLIKKNDVANQIGYRLQLMHSVRAEPGENCPASLANARLPGSPYRKATTFIYFPSFFISHY